MDTDKVFRALADPSRRQLLDWLHGNNGQTLGELCEDLDMTRQAVTKHLALLEDGNLRVTVRRGREKPHYLNHRPRREIHERGNGKYEGGRREGMQEIKMGLKGRRGKARQPREERDDQAGIRVRQVFSLHG